MKVKELMFLQINNAQTANNGEYEQPHLMRAGALDQYTMPSSTC